MPTQFLFSLLCFSGGAGSAIMLGPRKLKEILHTEGVQNFNHAHIVWPSISQIVLGGTYRSLWILFIVQLTDLLTSSLTLIKTKLFAYYCQLLQTLRLCLQKMSCWLLGLILWTKREMSARRWL